MMKLCDYGESALMIADFKASVARYHGDKFSVSKPEWIRLPANGARQLAERCTK
jgi:hypothetical protein